ncbi:MAG TPA: MMPL family transporter [Candidatus Dormibacteraeota bacterium]
MHGRSRLAAAWGGFVARHRWWFAAGWVVAFAALGWFSLRTASELSPSGFETDTQASRTAQVIEQHFPLRQGPVVIVVLRGANQDQVDAWRLRLRQLADPRTTNVFAFGEPGMPDTMIEVTSALTPDHFTGLAASVKKINVPGPGRAYVGGLAAVYDTFLQDSQQDLQSSERASLPLAVVLLLLVFGGVVAAGLPVLTGAATVSVAVALLGFVTRVHTVSVFALDVTSVVGLGLGIDYSLLVVSRFREERAAGRPVEEAVAETVGTAGLATVISGGTVMIGFGSLLLARLNVLWSMGLGGALVVGVSVLASLSLIPALLAIFGGRIDALALPLVRPRVGGGRFWHLLAGNVMRRPVLYIAAVLVVVVLLAAPARSLRPGVVGPESLPPDDPASVAMRLSQTEFGMPAHYPIEVLVRGIGSVAQAAAFQPAVQQAAGQQHVLGIANLPPEPPIRDQYLQPPYALYDVTPPAPPNTDATDSFLTRLNSWQWPSGMTVQVTGEAAGYKDFLDVLFGDFPRIAAAVVGLTLLLLGLAFRSVALPLKAVIMNLLSVGAAMGVLTWVFQEGHLASTLNFQAVGFVDATIPIIIFAALFGLSMDYEVFLLSRIREEYVIGRRSNEGAVAVGMARTGRIITSAALIMVVVIGTLAFSHLALDKELGVTFAVAVLLDATLIRLLLVPAMMRVMGSVNWWPGARGRQSGAEREAAVAAGV